MTWWRLATWVVLFAIVCLMPALLGIALVVGSLTLLHRRDIDQAARDAQEP